MLPFLKNKMEGSSSEPVEIKKREPDEESDYDGLHACAEDLMNAVHAKDIPGIAEALRAAFQVCDSEPHEEGEHI